MYYSVLSTTQLCIKVHHIPWIQNQERKKIWYILEIAYIFNRTCLEILLLFKIKCEYFYLQAFFHLQISLWIRNNFRNSWRIWINVLNYFLPTDRSTSALCSRFKVCFTTLSLQMFSSTVWNTYNVLYGAVIFEKNFGNMSCCAKLL